MLPNIVTGTVTATGAAMNIQLGFKPKKVLIINETTQIGLEWTDTMAAAKGLKTLQAGTRSFIASGGISQFAGSAGPVALTGTLAVTAGSAAVTGSGSKFLSEVKVGDLLAVPGVGATGIGGSATTDQAYIKVIAIASDTALTAQVVSDYTASGKAAFNTSGIAEGFTIGTDSVNTNTNVLHYVAHRIM
jgi:hypothetical protein